MITIEDCEAFCDAHPASVSELSCEECLTLVQAYARAHEAMLHGNVLPALAAVPATPHRLAA